MSDEIPALLEALRADFPVVYLDFRSIDRFLYRIRDIDILEDHVAPETIERLDRCNIYMLCRRARLSIVPDSITWDEATISLRVWCSAKGVRHEGMVSIPRIGETRPASAFRASEYPHRELIALDNTGDKIQEILLPNYAHVFGSLPPFAKQLEVLYIGKGISKNAQDRLGKHETLQRVLADLNSDDPDAELFALVHSFDYRRSVGGTVQPGSPDLEAGLREKLKVYHPTLEDKVSLIEAAAISYFRTAKYNVHYMDFPTTDSDAAMRARAAGADYVVVQIDTVNIGGVEIYSEAIPPAATHYIVKRIAK